ncbi:MAG: hypothetical protein U9R14_04280, partial [Patescibacteria group bacterium]|nr:hypothetical protein [Patescibacteria group bacterium]
VVIWFKGILPVLLRIGNGLAKRKIAIFAKNDNLVSLKNLLLDSGLFNKNNISEITTHGDIGIAEKTSIYLIYWHDWSDKIDEILSKVKDGTALVVYAPQELGFIPSDKMARLNEKRNVVVANFRGRLLNDITTSIITTNYK